MESKDDNNEGSEKEQNLNNDENKLDNNSIEIIPSSSHKNFNHFYKKK